MLNKIKRSGYSFIEAIVAIAILSGVIVLALNVITSNADTEVVNRDSLTVNALSEDAIAHIESFYYNNLRKFGQENAEECGLMLKLYTGEASGCQAASNNLKLATGDLFLIETDLANSSFSLVKSQIELINAGQFSDIAKVYSTEISGFNKFIQSSNQNTISEAQPTKYYRLAKRVTGEDSTFKFEILVGWSDVSNPQNVQKTSFKITN
jgi:type II secretory pathway pseudopilin PulG